MSDRCPSCEVAHDGLPAWHRLTVRDGTAWCADGKPTPQAGCREMAPTQVADQQRHAAAVGMCEDASHP